MLCLSRPLADTPLALLCSTVAQPALFLIRQALESQGSGLFSLGGTSLGFPAILGDIIPRPLGTVLVPPIALL